MSKEENDCQEIIKVILLGECGAGKTCLINAYFGNKFKDNVASTDSPESERKTMKINKKDYLIEIWDTAGQEKYRSMNNLFIKGSKVVIFVYDATEEKSFSELNYWVETTKEILGKSAIYGIAGNKADKVDNIEISEKEGEKYAKDNEAIFCSTSAKEDSKGFQKFLDNSLHNQIY